MIKITEGHMFGHEEIVNCLRNRVFKAETGNTPVVCYYINR